MVPAFKQLEVMNLSPTIKQHCHTHHQVVIGLSGQSEFDVDGIVSVVYPGLGCLVAANCKHSFLGLGDNELLVLNLPIGLEGNDEIDHRISRLFSCSGYFKLDHQSQQLITLLTAEMKANPTDILLQQACTMTLICSLQRHFIIPSCRRQQQRLDIDVIDNYIQCNINRKIPVSQLAAIVFLAESQFYALFKIQTGNTPQRYILQKRLQLARQLLDASELTLVYIAQACGFACQSRFSQAFRRLYGIPPARYQQQKLFSAM